MIAIEFNQEILKILLFWYLWNSNRIDSIKKNFLKILSILPLTDLKFIQHASKVSSLFFRHLDFFDMVRNEDEKELTKRYGVVILILFLIFILTITIVKKCKAGYICNWVWKIQGTSYSTQVSFKEETSSQGWNII